MRYLTQEEFKNLLENLIQNKLPEKYNNNVLISNNKKKLFNVTITPDMEGSENRIEIKNLLIENTDFHSIETRHIILFSNCTFTNSEILTSAVKFFNCTFSDCSFIKNDFCNFISCSIFESSFKLGRSIFEHSSLTNVEIIDSSFSSKFTKFDNCTINSSQNIGIVFDLCELERCIITGVFYKIYFEKSFLSNCIISKINTVLFHFLWSHDNYFSSNLYDLSIIELYSFPPSSLLEFDWKKEINENKEIYDLAMVYDCSNHPNPTAFEIWSEGGTCPYNFAETSRMMNFSEDRARWQSKMINIKINPWDIIKKLFELKNIVVESFKEK